MTLPRAISRCAVILFCGGLAGAAPSSSFEQITFGPKHHFFGYIGQCRTIPWSADGRYILALETGFIDRLPEPEDSAGIVLIDTQEGNKIIRLDSSRGWNPQQGTMFYWNPRNTSEFLFNDRDQKSGRVFAVLYDATQKKRVRDYRFDDTPVGNSGMAQNGEWFLAINYARLARLRPVTGYPKAYDWTEKAAAPSDDGIFRIDVESGKKQLLVSYAQLKEKLRELDPRIETRHLFINHTLCNRESDRIYFYCRADFEGEESQRLNVPFTMKTDGSDLTVQRVFIGGHPDWAEGSLIIGAKDKQQVVFDILTQRIVSILGGSELFPSPGGDIAVSPDAQWLVNGHSEKGSNAYTFLELPTRRVIRSPKLPVGTWRSKEVRLDPAPCWNRTGDAILVTGLASDGTRQMFLYKTGK